MPPLSWGLSSVPAAHVPYCASDSRLALSRKGLVAAASLLSLIFIAKLYSALAVPFALTLSLMPVQMAWHGFVMQQDGCLA